MRRLPVERLGRTDSGISPYCFFNYTNPFVAMIPSYLGIGNYWGKDGADRVEKEERVRFSKESLIF